MTPVRVPGLRHMLDSVSFRLALNYGLLGMFTMLVLIAVFYVQTVGALRQADMRQVTATGQRMTNQFQRGGRPAIVDTMKRMLADNT